jgi:hypothetical protein
MATPERPTMEGKEKCYNYKTFQIPEIEFFPISFKSHKRILKFGILL